MPEFDTYLSPFTWRYGTPAMRHLWSEDHKRLLWRQMWVALAEIQTEFGLVTPEQAAELRLHMTEIDVGGALKIEAEIQHDLMAEIRLFASQSPLGGKVLHLAATSADIEENADVLRQRESLDLLLGALSTLLRTCAELIDQWADTPVMAFTHLQPAEPTTLGYRLAFHGQDLLSDHRKLTEIRSGLRGKGFKGAVGTSAALAGLIGVENLPRFEARMAEKLDLAFYPVTSQITPRKQEYELISALAGLGASLHKLAFDLRLLQSPPFGEMSEPFSENQVGSSAMPFKRNPIRAEKINSLARTLAAMPRTAWDNAALSLLERTLDDSANRRSLLPEAFLLSDELLQTAIGILSGLVISEHGMRTNLEAYSPFSATEPLLAALVKAGADRQEMHAHLRRLSMQAWEQVRLGKANPLPKMINADTAIKRFLSRKEIQRLLDVRNHVGDAPRRARECALGIRRVLGAG